MLDDAGLKANFPNLLPGNYANTNPPSRAYNCIAWAAGVDDAWWEPATGPGYYWPVDLPAGDEIASVVRAYEMLGYAQCLTPDTEEGREKVAVYGDADGYTHAARQLENGRWTSKLGECQDIEHTNPHVLSGGAYGSVVCFLKRSKPT